MKERVTQNIFNTAAFRPAPRTATGTIRTGARTMLWPIAAAAILFVAVPNATADPPWWNSAWQYRKEIVIDHTQVSGGGYLAGFPVLVSHTSTDFPGHAQPNGDDFAFIDYSGIKLNHEIELYNNGTGKLIAWVNVPVLSSSVDTTLYLYYGNPVAPDQQEATAVWDASYLGVYHLDESAGSVCYDSTMNNNHGTYQGGDLPTQVLSQVGYGQDFDGTADYISMPEGCHTPLSGTVEMWTTQDDNAPTGYYYDRPASGGFITLYCDGSAFGFYSESALPGYWNISGSANMASQKYVSIGWEEGSQNFRIDATSQGTATATSLQDFAYSLIYLGESHLAPHIGLDGMMDEVRLSNIKRSDAWTDTSYRTMNDPSSFMTIGPEDAQPDINCEDLTDFDFGAVDAGTCSSEHTWTVTNEGGGQLTGSITLEDADAGEFEFTQGGGAFTLEADESRIVGVRFCPTSTGAKAATLRIWSNDPDENPCDLALDGTGTGPDINCEDLTGFDFGEVDAGTCGLEYTWTVTNEGTTALIGTSGLEGADADEFEFTRGGGAFALDPDQSLTVGVQFRPTSGGAKSATLRINSNDADENPCDLALDGTGTGPGINCEDLDDYDWGAILDECSDVHYWSIINVGTETLS
ncbi:MAG: DUF2341 domain-containing protein, partial [Phycisphaerae bacterium]|nr:DUF2341 domain-containing protein [Phycisphaerae bacterium]